MRECRDAVHLGCMHMVLGAGCTALAFGCTGQLPHQRLGVAPNTPPAELKKAYRKRCLELHPDKHKGEANKAWAEQEFMALGKAYETLLAEAVRRYQGASSRPTRAGAGGGEASGEDDRRQRTRDQHARQTDNTRQTSSDREKAERHRREQERRAAGGGRSQGGREGQDRQSAEARRQREREREFRRLQEEERRWQEHARRRQQQHRQHESQQSRERDTGHDTEARLRAEREQLEREERHRREKMRRQKKGSAGRQGSKKGGSRDGTEEGRSPTLERQLRELAKGAQLVAFSMATEGTWAAIGHTMTHLLYVEAMPSLPQPVSAVSIPLSRVDGVKTGNNGQHVQIELKEDEKGVRQAPLQVVVGHHDLKSLTNLMDSLTRHCPRRFDNSQSTSGREGAPGAGGEGNAKNEGGGDGGGDGGRATEGSSGAGGEEMPTLMLVDNGLELLNDAYIRLSSIDGLEVLALTNSHLIHVMLPVPSATGAVGQAEVLKSPLLYITNVRSTSTGGLMIELGSSGAWEPIEMDAQHFPLPQLQHFFNTLHAAVLAAQRAQVESDARSRAHEGASPRLSGHEEGSSQDSLHGLDVHSDPGHGVGREREEVGSGSEGGVGPAASGVGAGAKPDSKAGRGELQERSIQELMGMAQTSLSSKDGRHLVMITADELMHVKAEDMAANVVSFHGKLRLVDRVSTTEEGRLRVELKSGGEHDAPASSAEAGNASRHAALELDPQVFEMDALSDLFEQLYLAVVRAGGSYTGRTVGDEVGHEPQMRDSDRRTRAEAYSVEDSLSDTQYDGKSDAAASGAREQPAPPWPRGHGPEGRSTSEICKPTDDSSPRAAHDALHSLPLESEGERGGSETGDRSSGEDGEEVEEEDEVGSLSWRLQALEKELHLDEEEHGGHGASVDESDMGSDGGDGAASGEQGRRAAGKPGRESEA